LILKNWKAWLVGMVLIPVILGGPAFMLFKNGSDTAGLIIAIIAAVISYAWLSWGLFYWRKYSAVYWAGVVIHGTTVAVLASVLIFRSGRQALALAVAGFWLLTAAFFVGIWLIRQFLSFSHPVFSIAKTVVDEALRMKVGLFFIVLILLVVPIFPIVQDFSERLQYRMQAFLTWSTLLVSVLLSFMSVCLGAWTVCSEVKNKQIYLSMSKPVRRYQYIMGKWLGLILLNLVLVVVAGGGIYVFALVLEATPAKEQADRDAIREQVLVAREASFPEPMGDTGFNEQIQKRIKELQSSASRIYGEEKDGVSPKTFEAAKTQVITEWLTVAPNNRATYVYRGLQNAKKVAQQANELDREAKVMVDEANVLLNQTKGASAEGKAKYLKALSLHEKAQRLRSGNMLMLRMKPNLSPRPEDDLGLMYVWINGQMVTPPDRPIRVLTSTFQTYPIDIDLIKDDGTLELTLNNITPPDGKSPVAPSITFSTADGLELLYKVDSFENNLVRMLLIIWFRVVFLSIVGIMTGTFLTFPVAALLGSMVLIVAYFSGFLLESLNAYATLTPQAQHQGNALLDPFYALWDKISSGKYNEALKQCIRMFGEAFVFFIPSFSKHDPGPLISDGRVITWDMVRNAGLMIGLVWSGVVCILAWGFFWLKELARVIV
jgi:hypothetical protein